MAEESNDKKSRVDWWAIATGAWIAVVLGVGIAKRFWTMELNSMGDYVAGAFAPPALIWLVRGYYQQGKALEIQLRELKQSVAEFSHQSALFSQQTDLMERSARGEQVDRTARHLEHNIEQIPTRLILVLRAFKSLETLEVSKLPAVGITFNREIPAQSADAAEFKKIINHIVSADSQLKKLKLKLKALMWSQAPDRALELETVAKGLLDFDQAGKSAALALGSDEWNIQTSAYGLDVVCEFIQSELYPLMVPPV